MKRLSNSTQFLISMIVQILMAIIFVVISNIVLDKGNVSLNPVPYLCAVGVGCLIIDTILISILFYDKEDNYDYNDQQ